ncbi:MAG: hypothetical protein WA718_08200 [Terriglobales bacterium]
MKRATRKRATSLLALLVWSLLSSASMCAQELQGPDSPYSSNIFGPDLVAWSEQQKPQPVPPALPTNPPAQPAMRTLTGRIISDHNRYVLMISSIDIVQLVVQPVVQLEDQQKAMQYDGREVKLRAMLSEDGRRVRVISFELI